eukprot:629354-Rhodomonas_salina.1
MPGTDVAYGARLAPLVPPSPLVPAPTARVLRCSVLIRAPFGTECRPIRRSIGLGAAVVRGHGLGHPTNLSART